MNPEELLAHSDFVQALARSLVVDEHRASDVVQDTWVAALEHPPAKDRPARAWLATVVRNFTRIMHRSETSRHRREQDAFRAEEPPSPEEIATREESRRRMIEAVLGLEEPYRGVILRRYYQDQSPRDIARHMDLPLETVRTQLKRGIEQLRVKLDESHNGNRKAWCAALAPLAVLGHEKAAAATSATITGASLLKVGLAAALIIALPVVLWQAVPVEPSNAAVPPTESAPVTHPGGETENRNERVAMVPAVFSDEEEAAVELVTWTGVLYNYDNAPLEGAKIRLATDGNDAVHETTTEAGGDFKIEEVIPADYSVYVDLDLPPLPDNLYSDPGFFKWGEITFDHAGEAYQDIRLPGDATLLCGRVIDDRTGGPYRWDGNRIGREAYGGYYLVMMQKIGDYDTVFEAMVHPEDATFFFMGVPAGSYDLLLFGPGLHYEYKLKHSVEAAPAVNELTIRVQPLGELSLLLGSLVCPGHFTVKMSIRPGLGCVEAGLAIRCEDQSFLLDPGLKQITFQHAEWGEHTRNVEIRAGEMFELAVLPEDFGDAANTLVIDGRLRRADGTPVTPAALDFLVGGYPFPNKADCITDEQGRFVWKTGIPGRQEVVCLMLTDTLLERVREEGWVQYFYDEPMYSVTLRGIEIPDVPPEGFALDLALPAGCVRGTLVDGLTGGPPNGELPYWRAHLVDFQEMGNIAMRIGIDQGRFEMEGIPAGQYRFVVWAPGYVAFRSEMLELKDGQILDLGRIELEPTGCVILDVRDATGGRVHDSEAWCSGRKVSGNMETGLGLKSGKMLLWGLPTGGVRLEVKSPSHSSEFFDLRLDPAQPQEIEVVFKPPT